MKLYQFIFQQQFFAHNRFDKFPFYWIQFNVDSPIYQPKGINDIIQFKHLILLFGLIDRLGYELAPNMSSFRVNPLI